MNRRLSAETIDENALKCMIGYNCRRAYNAILERTKKHITERKLPQGAFATLLLLYHNPGLSSLQVCRTLGVLPPNLVALVATLESGGMIERRVNQRDARSLDLHLTPAGRRLVARIEQKVIKAEMDATSMLSDAERQLLVELLSRIYAGAKPVKKRAKKTTA